LSRDIYIEDAVESLFLLLQEELKSKTASKDQQGIPQTSDTWGGGSKFSVGLRTHRLL
jgi:hypothetical protein